MTNWWSEKAMIFRKKKFTAVSSCQYMQFGFSKGSQTPKFYTLWAFWNKFQPLGWITKLYWKVESPLPQGKFNTKFENIKSKLVSFIFQILIQPIGLWYLSNKTDMQNVTPPRLQKNNILDCNLRQLLILLGSNKTKFIDIQFEIHTSV